MERPRWLLINVAAAVHAINRGVVAFDRAIQLNIGASKLNIRVVVVGVQHLLEYLVLRIGIGLFILRAARMLVQRGVGGAPFDEEDNKSNRDDHNRQPVDESPPFADETNNKPKDFTSALPRVLPRILHAAVLPFVHYRPCGDNTECACS